MIKEFVINDDWKVPEFGITIDPINSYFPPMPETIDTDVSIEGVDGEINLSTTYGPRNFELLCYAEDGLNTMQKNYFINKIVNFLHKYKNEPFRLVIKPYFKSYFVKYSGAIDYTHLPQSVSLNIPLKSVSSFGYLNTKLEIVGNSKKESNTVEPVGFICTIKGPASNPIKIKLNDVEMIYNNELVEGETLIINTKIFTVTKIDSEGNETNVLKYFGDNFPRIVYGDNILNIVSGISNPNNVKVEWEDLTF